MRRTFLPTLLGPCLGLAGCAGGADEDRANGTGTIVVPGQYATIGAALAAAKPGDTVLVSPGTYRETVRVDKPDLILRGTDRGTVVIDGEGLRGNGVLVTADRVRVENLTVRGHNLNGVLVTGMSDSNGGLARGSDGYHRLDPDRFPPIKGFAVRHVTASNNGLYGIYAFDANDGVIEHSYASGHADSGFYVGQCDPCGIVVRDNIGEFNAVGYEQANASQAVHVLHNRFSHNRVGLTLLSDYQEAFVPQHKAVVAGNLVADNHEARTPAQAEGGFGIGIGVAGGQDNLFRNNRVAGNPVAGFLVTSSEDIAPLRNRFVSNVATGNGIDLAYAASRRAPGSGNCLQGAGLGTTRPAGLLRTWRCPAPPGSSVGVPVVPGQVPDGISFRSVGPPPVQPQMTTSGPARAPVIAASAMTLPPADLFAERVRAP